VSFLDFILVSEQIEQLTDFSMLPCLFPKTDKLAEKRKQGVVLYKKPKRNDTIAYKQIHINRQLCTSSYR